MVEQKKEKRRKRSICAVFGFFMGIMTILGVHYSRNEPVTGSFFASLLLTAAASALYAVLLNLFFTLILPDGEKTARRPGGGESFSWFPFWPLFFLTGAVYVPVFLAVYPGIYSYDASVQVLQVFGEMPLSTHHPLLHTFFFCGCLKLGELLFGSYQAGMAIHSVCQSALMAAIFSLTLSRMYRRGASRLLLAVSWLFLALNPYLAVFSFVTTKDVLFGGFFLLAFDWALELTASPERFLASRRKTAVFFAAVLIMCLFRNQGIYVFLFFTLFFLIRLRRLPRKTAGAFLLPALAVTLAWYLLSGPLPSAFGVEKGDAREMLCVPMQQLARVYHEAPELLTEEETAYIEELIDPAALDQYVRINADPVKSGFRTEVLKEDPGRFLRNWAAIGLRHPRIYLESFFMGNWGYWYPGDSQYWINYILFDGAFTDETYNVLHITRSSHFPALESWLRSITLTPAFQSVPVLSFLLNQAFPFWLMLTSAAFLIWKRRTTLLPALALILGYWGTLLLGPVTALRYALPLVYCVPLMAELLLGRDGQSRGGWNFGSPSKEEAD